MTMENRVYASCLDSCRHSGIIWSLVFSLVLR